MRAGGVDLRLVIPALFVWASTGLLVFAPRCGLAMCGICGALVAVIGVTAALRRSRWTGIAVLVLAACCAAGAATALAGAVRHPSQLDGVASGHAVVVEGTVATAAGAARATPFGEGEKVSFQLTADDIVVGRSRVTGQVPVLVFAAARAREPAIGERVQLAGTAKATSTADDISMVLYAGELRRLAPPPAGLAWADGLRARFRTAAAAMPGDGGALLPGLAIGDDTRVPASLDGDMKASSLSHLTAVSGSNCAVIVGGVLLLAGFCGLPRLARVGAALAALAGFVVLVTPGASVLRAAAMAAVVVLGTALGRPGRALPALSLAVLVLLLHDPWLSHDYGFALSVAATAALLVLAPPLAERLRRWLPRWLALGLSVPLAAQLACQPVLVLLNPSVPLYGVVANILAEPAAPVATVIGLIACLVTPLSSHLATPLMWCAWAPAAWIAGVARATTKLPASALPWPVGPAGFSLAVVLTAAIVLLLTRPRSPGGRFVRTGLSAAFAMALVIAVGAHAGPALARHAAIPRDWVVGLCDVGQGDAIVLKSGDAIGVIDTGPSPQALRACLHLLGIRRIALLVLTHYDEDHIGGVDAVAGLSEHALVGQPDDAVAEHRLDLLRERGADVHIASRGDQGSLGALRWRVLWPDGTHPDMSTSNEGGLTLDVTGQGLRMLFLADLDARAQDALLGEGDIGVADVVKVAHHGSADQSARIYGLVRARLGLISCGTGNAYGHPAAKALALLRAAGTQPARTDLEGTLLVTARHGRLGLWTQTHPPARALWAPATR